MPCEPFFVLLAGAGAALGIGVFVKQRSAIDRRRWLAENLTRAKHRQGEAKIAGKPIDSHGWANLETWVVAEYCRTAGPEWRRAVWDDVLVKFSDSDKPFERVFAHVLWSDYIRKELYHTPHYWRSSVDLGRIGREFVEEFCPTETLRLSYQPAVPLETEVVYERVFR